MTFKEAVHLIDNAGKRKKLYPIYLRLDRLRLLFELLGIDIAAPSIHIAGTSGKGSTSSLTAETLKQAGYTVGLHTTPHLQTPRERMQINGTLPTEQEFADCFEIVYNAALQIEDSHSYGSFSSQELIFSLTAYYFKTKKVDIAVIETFMGGQYDPTNIIKPLVSVITNVDLDHVGLLGKTIEAIAMVKSGVIKPETPFITGATQPTVLEIFKKRAADVKTSCIIIGEESAPHQSRLLGQKGSILSAQVLNNIFSNLHISLLGKHQVNNALLSLYIVQVLRSRGWLIADEAIRQAFISAFIPGRMEIVEHIPMIVLDGAHNPAKTKALAGSIRRIFPKKKIVFVFAMKKGKALEDSMKPLLPLASKFIVTRFSEKKSQSTKAITQIVKAKGIPATTRLDPLAAVTLAKNQVKKDEIICVTGSLYLVGKLRSHWHPETIDSTPSYNEYNQEISAVGEHAFPILKESR